MVLLPADAVAAVASGVAAVMILLHDLPLDLPGSAALDPAETHSSPASPSCSLQAEQGTCS